MENLLHEVTITGDRLDHYLAVKDLCTSRSESTKLIKDGCVLVNQKPVKASYKVVAGDQIAINKPSVKMSDLTPKDLKLDVLFEDQDIIVLNKAAGIAVHPGAGNYVETLVHGLLFHCKDLSGIGGVERPGIVHRLDKGTSGVMVVAKNDKAHQHLSQQFQDKKVTKIYRALCVGEIKKTEQRLVHLMKRAEINRKKFVVNQKKGKEAITNVKVLQRTKKVTEVAVRIETGRTHQIRVHLHYIGHPILGDAVYGGTKKLPSFKPEELETVNAIGHQLLHAEELTLQHPRTLAKMTFKADLPSDYKAAIEHYFGENSK